MSKVWSIAWFLLTTLLLACVTFMDPNLGHKFADAVHGKGSADDAEE